MITVPTLLSLLSSISYCFTPLGYVPFWPETKAKCLETGEAVAIKKVLQDRRYKNRELQLMRVMDHPNIISLSNYFFSTTSRDELFLNLVMEYVPETIFRVIKHYSSMKQRMPLIYVKLYTYQVWGFLCLQFGLMCCSCSSLFLLKFYNDWVWDVMSRSLGDWRISILHQESTIDMWSLKIFW